jgi:hypothetical protein
MTVPTNLLAALNGLAAAADTAGDNSTISLLTQIYQLADYGMPATVYQSAATSATNYWTKGTFYPAGSIAPTFDSTDAIIAPGSPGFNF